MQLACAHCGKVLAFTEIRPSFCAYCGKSLPDAGTKPGSTVEFDHEAATRAPEPVDGVTDSDPAEVGGYRLLRVLGEGAMGRVYEAEDAATGRRVALKLIGAQYAGSAEAVERFRREGRLASALSHPRCVFVLAADEQAGRPYIVMELMPGDTLEGLIQREGPLPVEQALPKILDVIEGLKEAHRVGVIHRDVKPSNCLLEPDGRVKVGDFGLAKSLVQGAHLTKTGSFLGTVLYASPEQIRGEPTGPQADVYSVAATLYCLLTGQAPFQGGDAAATLARIVCDPPPPMRSLRPDLPEALDRVVLRGLERDRTRRWRDLDAFEEALRPFLPGKLSLAGLGVRFGAYLIDSLALLVLTVTVALLVAWLWGNEKATDADTPLYYFLSRPIWLVYFAVSEGLWGASPAKRLLGLRVVRAGGFDRPGIPRALLRAGLLFFTLDLGTIVTLLTNGFAAPGVADDGTTQPANLFDWAGLIEFALTVVGIVLVVCPMRARNGYLGLHEWASGTRVIRLPEAGRRSAFAGGQGLVLSQPLGLRERVGSFRVLGAVWENGPEVVLLGEDPALGRKALLWLRPSSAGTALSDARRTLSRATRPRWLAGGRDGDRLWDAFLAPAGHPLPEVVSAAGRLSWADARYLLSQLADELSAAEQDKTLPASLTAGQVWVQADGRLQLVDPPLSAEPAAGALTLLRDVAVLALGGRPRPAGGFPGVIRVPLPRHAAELLAPLCGSGQAYGDVREFQSALAATADKPATVGRGRRFAHLVLQGLFLLFGLLVTVESVLPFCEDVESRMLLLAGLPAA